MSTLQTLERMSTARGVSSEDLKLGFLGLSFKPDIDDLRNSPALQIVGEICSATACEVLVTEPNIEMLPASLADRAQLVSYDRASKCDLVVALVAHSQFRVSGKPQGKVLDFAGVWA